jgi:hypothetical protein
MTHHTRFLLIIVCCVQLVLLALPAIAEFGEPIGRSGNWSVLRTLHAVTNEPSCVAIYKDRFEIRMDENDLFISLNGRGDVSSVVLQFDGDPAKQARPASEAEKKANFVGLDGAEFEELMSWKRLRAQIRTTDGAAIEEDIDLDGVKEVHRELTGSKCSEPPSCSFFARLGGWC